MPRNQQFIQTYGLEDNEPIRRLEEYQVSFVQEDDPLISKLKAYE